MIDWTDRKVQITPHFTVHDCLWLNHWNRLANAADGLNDDIIQAILNTLQMAEQIRTLLQCPMIVTSLYRPPAYSPVVGGSAHDVHTKGVAIDFTTFPILSIEDAKNIIRPQMEALDIRMEAGTTDWIHIDRWEVGPSGREFTA